MSHNKNNMSSSLLVSSTPLLQGPPPASPTPMIFATPGAIALVMLAILVLLAWAVTFTVLYQQGIPALVSTNTALEIALTDVERGAMQLRADAPATALGTAMNVDLAKLQHMRRTLTRVVHYADKHSVRLYPFFGTLLGLLRNDVAGPLYHDDDLDTMITVDQAPALLRMIRDADLLAEMDVRFDCNMVQFTCKGDLPVGAGYHLDIFFLARFAPVEEPDSVAFVTYFLETGEMNRIVSPCYQKCRFSYRELLAGERCDFWDIPDAFCLPGSREVCEAALRERYGADVMTHACLYRSHSSSDAEAQISGDRSVVLPLSKYPCLKLCAPY